MTIKEKKKLLKLCKSTNVENKQLGILCALSSDCSIEFKAAVLNQYCAYNFVNHAIRVKVTELYSELIKVKLTK
jgi:hypothetical protein